MHFSQRGAKFADEQNQTNLIMKRFLLSIASLVAFMAIIACEKYVDDRPVSVDKLPEAAREFLNQNYQAEDILYVIKDDDIVYPDYTVGLANGVEVEFYNDGALKSIESKNGIATDLIPIQIVEFVKVRYPDAYFVEYEVDKHHYEVKLSNRLELKFNKNFNLMKIDD